MTTEKNSWKIDCDHTPETIDRIMLPIRKRGLKVTSLHYQQTDLKNAICTVEFELDSTEAARIFKNMMRIHDIQKVTIL